MNGVDRRWRRTFPWLLALMIGCVRTGGPSPRAASSVAPPSVAGSAPDPLAIAAPLPPDPVFGLLDAIARFEPEAIGASGIAGHEEDVAYIAPDAHERQLAALAAASKQIADALAKETDRTRRQDLEIVAKAARRYTRAEVFDDRRLLPYRDLVKTIYLGLMQHLRPGGDPKRAVARVRRYADGFAMRARQRLEAKLPRSEAVALLFPTTAELEQHLANADVYLGEVEELFKKANPVGWQEPFARMRMEVSGYLAVVRARVLPNARSDFKLPADVYERRLEDAGVDMPRAELVARARAALDKTKLDMRALVKGGDYRAVLRADRAKRVGDTELVALYAKRVSAIETILRRENLLTLPTRPVHVRMATAGESAQNPSPTIDVQALFKKDEDLSFLIPIAGPPRPGETSAAYDDFAYPAVSWTIAAHEARPGHELQFSILKERGLSLARTLFAFNSANVEGWGLYAETIVYPFMPADGKLSSLRMRALREARAFLDPGLHDGTISLDEARRVLADDLAFGDGVVRQELDRYTFLSPGQATAYFFGLEKLRALRAEVKAKRGKAFDARLFHDAVLDAGLLPPDLLRDAVLSSLQDLR